MGVRPALVSGLRQCGRVFAFVLAAAAVATPALTDDDRVESDRYTIVWWGDLPDSPVRMRMGRSNALLRGAGAAIGWPGPSLDVLSAVLVVGGRRPRADDCGRGRESDAWVERSTWRFRRIDSVLSSPGATEPCGAACRAA